MKDEPKKVLGSDFSKDFVTKMENRMFMGYCKYGSAAKRRNDVDFIKSLGLRLDEYARTGNTEYLIDAANFAMMEFLYPSHPNAFFKATDADGSPGVIWKENTDVGEPGKTT